MPATLIPTFSCLDGLHLARSPWGCDNNLLAISVVPHTNALAVDKLRNKVEQLIACKVSASRAEVVIGKDSNNNTLTKEK